MARRQIHTGLMALMFAGAAGSLAGAADAAEIVVQWAPPPGRRLVGASAVELRRASNAADSNFLTSAPITGSIASPGAHFPAHVGSAYDLRLELDDGTVLQGVNLNWYSAEPPDPTAGPVGADDRKEIVAIVHNTVGPNGFFNHADILALRGSSERAVALVQLVRDSAFHSGAPGEVIWRVELWYLKNENGGWIRVPQVSRMIHRERLGNLGLFERAVSHLRWVPAMGDVEMTAGTDAVTVQLPGNAGVVGIGARAATRADAER